MVRPSLKIGRELAWLCSTGLKPVSSPRSRLISCWSGFSTSSAVLRPLRRVCSEARLCNDRGLAVAFEAYRSLGTHATGHVSAPAQLETPLPAPEDEPTQEDLDSLMDVAGTLRLRCSVLSADGGWTFQEGTFEKAKLCKDNGVDSRDLQNIDSPRPGLVPVILARKTFILVSILNFRALIKPDQVTLFQPEGVVDSDTDKRLKRHLQLSIKDESNKLPFEHRALDSVLTITVRVLHEELQSCHSLVRQVLADLGTRIDETSLRSLLSFSKQMANLKIRAQSIKRAADEVLSNDEDLATMYITSTALGKPRAVADHVQLEFLLESFTKQVEEVITQTESITSDIQATLEVAELMLDSVRNSLMDLDIKIGVSTLSVGTGALIAGVFGMNLTSNLESTPFLFYGTTATLLFVAGIIWRVGYRVLRRLRHVTLPARPSTGLAAPQDDPPLR